MILSNKSDTTFFSDKRFPLTPFIESYSKKEVNVSFFPGCIICHELNQEFAPIGDEIKKFTCKEGDGFILEIEGSFNKVAPRILNIQLKKIENIDQFSYENIEGSFILYGQVIKDDEENPSTKRIPLAKITKYKEEEKEEEFYIETLQPNKEFINLYLKIGSDVILKTEGKKQKINTNLYILT